MKGKRFFIIAGFILAIIVSFPHAALSQLKPGEPIVIGVPTALGSSEGASGWKAVQMAVDEINAKGGVSVGSAKHLLQAYSIDTREHEAGIPVHDALLAVEKLILEKKPHGIAFGAFRSEVLIASMDLIAKYKVPYICSHALTPAYQKKILESYDKYKYCFRDTLNAIYVSTYLQEAMKFLKKEFGFSKAYIVAQDVLWAKATGENLKKWWEGNGWEVAGFDNYATGSTDFSPSLIKAKAQKAQVILVLFDMPQGGILIKQARSMRVPALLVGTIGPTHMENSWEVFKGGIEGMVNIQFDLGSMPVKAVPKSIEFNRNFGKKWGEDARRRIPTLGQGAGYDAVYILANAIERAGTVDPDAMVSAIEKTDMLGVNGRIRFGKDHQVIYGLDPKEMATVCIYQWKKPGKRVPVFPESIAEGKIELPRNMKLK
jgi:branched-chain amino acid transport system substrate-binding protein